MIPSARHAALVILRDVRTGKLDLSSAQARVRSRLSDPRDRALVTEIVAGTLRWKARLDFALQKFSDRPLSKLDEDILDLLRLSIYQLLYLKRVPDHAVVNEAVRLTKNVGKRSAGGFVNAVLRRFLHDKKTIDFPFRPTSTEFFNNGEIRRIKKTFFFLN